MRRRTFLTSAAALLPGTPVASVVDVGARDRPTFMAVGMVPYGVTPYLVELEDERRGVHGTDERLSLVNVNFPARPPRGTLWTCQSVRHYDGKVVPAKDPMGRTHYWFTVVPVEATEEGSDRWAIEQGYVSMTPLTLDLTEHQALGRGRKLAAWKNPQFG